MFGNAEDVLNQQIAVTIVGLSTTPCSARDGPHRAERTSQLEVEKRTKDIDTTFGMRSSEATMASAPRWTDVESYVWLRIESSEPLT
ncbi:hypothetical protein CDAR_292571 [Caerostris darwini]|uniref:Uncharacterized protein n=1 Tax=Caerostris darwini TaxID=1538125 RepID=A0AAV4MSS8_9ARAC|nr:hypothetical protein CDAR_292571 [Caerostris darwini]